MLAICERISRKLRSQIFFFFTIVIWQMIVYKFFNGKQMISGSDRQQLAFLPRKVEVMTKKKSDHRSRSDFQD